MEKILTIELKKEHERIINNQFEYKYFLWFVNQLIKNSNQSEGEIYTPVWVSEHDIEHPKNEKLYTAIKIIINKGFIEADYDDDRCSEFRIAPNYFNLNEPIKIKNNENIN